MEFNIIELLLLGAMGVVGLTEWLKSFDRQDHLKKWYQWIPAVIAIPFGVIVTLMMALPWWSAPIFVLVELAFSVLGYTTILESIQKFVESKTKDE